MPARLCLYSSGPWNITVYGPASNGDVKPIATIAGTNTRRGLPYGIALGGSGST
jgi:hypothetical protein